MQFLTKKQNERKIQIIAHNWIKANINSAKFLGLIINNTLSWKDHIAALTSKLNKACYAVRSIKPFLSVDILRMIYYSYVHSVRSYVIIFLDNSHNSNSIFKIRKRILRIITNIVSCDSCHQLFKTVTNIFTSISIHSLITFFVTKNRGLFQSISEIHDLNTRFNHNLHLPSINLALVQKGVLYSESKIYNHLPSNIKVLSNDTKLFKSTLKSYLIEHTFHSLDEFYHSAS